MASKEFARWWYETGEWSEATFGPFLSRGPEGPFNHLKRELKEMEESDFELEEIVDGFFLLKDIASRAGYSYDELLDMLWDKLEKNKARKWKAPDKEGVVEHLEGT